MNKLQKINRGANSSSEVKPEVPDLGIHDQAWHDTLNNAFSMALFSKLNLRVWKYWLISIGWWCGNGCLSFRCHIVGKVDQNWGDKMFCARHSTDSNSHGESACAWGKKGKEKVKYRKMWCLAKFRLIKFVVNFHHKFDF